MSNAIYIDMNERINWFTKKSAGIWIDVQDEYGSGSVEVDNHEKPTNDIDTLAYLIQYGSDDSDFMAAIINFIWECNCDI